MKKVLRFLTLAAMLCIPWVTQAQETLTVYDGTTTSSYVPTYMLYWDDFTRCQYVIPATDLEEMDGGTISSLKFYTTSNNVPYTSVSTCDVYLMEVAYTSISAFEPTASATIVYSGTVSIVSAGGAGEMTITFATPYVYGGGNLLVGIENTTDAGYKSIYFYGQTVTGASVQGYNSSSLASVNPTQRNFIPKTTFTYSPGAVACERPATLESSSVTATGATLTWTGGSGTYNVEYKTAADVDWTTLLSSTTAVSHNMTSLAPATDYQVRVQSVCSGETSTWKTANFTTECGIITTFPWNESFDSYSGVTNGTTNNLPRCWDYINDCSYSSYLGYPVVYNSNSYSHSGNNHLRFYSYYYSTTPSYDPQPQYAVLPEMSGLSGLRMKLYARANSTSSYYDATFHVGVMTDPTDASTFDEVAEYTPSSTTYEQYIIPFDSYAGSGTYIAIKIDAADNTIGSSSSSYRSVCIDDITVEEIPSCLEPSALVFNGATTNTATLGWTAGGTEEKWDIYYATTNSAPTNSTAPIVAATEDNPCTISGLTAATTYYVWVRAHCDDGDGQQSPWIGGISFSTKCNPVAAFPWSEDFEGCAAGNFNVLCWRNEHISGSGAQIFKVSTSTNGTNNTHQLQLPDQTSGTMTMLVLPGMTLPNSNYQFVIDVFRTNSTYSPSDNPYEGIRIYASTNGEIEGATELAFIPRQYDETNGAIPAEAAEGWYTYEIPLGISGTCYIILRGENRYCSSTYMDNFVVNEMPSCLKPTLVTCTATTTTSATLSWTAGDPGDDAWQISYKTGAGEWSSPAGVTTNPYTLTGLTENITYDVRVRTNCGDGEENKSEWTATVTFTTPCAAITVDNTHPYIVDMMSDDIADCWTETDGTYHWDFDDSYGANFSSSGSSLQTSTKLVSPLFDFGAGDNWMSFTGYMEGYEGWYDDYTATLKVYYRTSPSGAWQELAGQSYSVTGDNDLDLDVAEVVLPAGTCQLAFEATSDYDYSTTAYLYDFTVEKVPSCRKPAALALVSKTAHAASLSFNETGTADAWVLEYSVNSDFSSATEVTSGFTESAGTVTVDLSTLAQSTTYYVRVKANCGGGDYSAWCNSINFTTLAGNAVPTGLAVNPATITNNQATASWTAVATNILHESYDIYWALATVTEVPAEPTTPNLISGIAATSQVISVLAAETEYKVWVRDNCGTDGYSAWSSPVTFTTASNCQTPDGLAAASVTNNSATISWNTYGQSGFNLRYSADGGANWNPVNNVTTPHTLNGILGNTAYQVQVQATCTTTDEWSAVLNFTTKCDATSAFPITYGFETTEDFPDNSYAPTTNTLGNCWRNQATVQNGNYANRVWGTSTTYKHGGSQALVLPDKGNSTNFAKTMLVFPPMNFTSANGYVVSFWIYRNNSGSNPEGFKVYASNADTIDGSAVLLGHYSRNYNIAYPQVESGSAWYQYETTPITLTGTVYLIFEGQSYYGNATYVDDITIDEAPSCLSPSVLEVTATTTTSATLSWTENGSATDWVLQYGTDNTFATNTEEKNVNGTPSFDLIGLTANTTYYARVKADCGGSDESDWSSTYNFTTECESIVVDAGHTFTEGFENATFAPSCWENIESGTHAWSRNTSYHHGDGSASAYSGFYGDIYLVMPNLAISDEADGAKLTFWSYNSYTGEYDKNSVVLIDGMGEHELWSPTSVSGSWVETTIDLTAYLGQTVSLAFKYEGSNAHGWYIDDIEVSVFNNPTKAIVANSWYAIASPMHDDGQTYETVTNVTNLATGTYDLLRYNEADGKWESQKEVLPSQAGFTTLEQGRGYIYRRAAATTLTFTGLPNSGAVSRSITHSCGDVNIKGFNLVGNPYKVAYAPTMAFYTLQPNGTWTVHPASPSNKVAAGEGFFIYDNSNSTYAFAAPSGAKGAPRNSAASIALTVSNDDYSDVAYAIFDDGESMPKMAHLNSEAPMLSIPQGNRHYAIAYLDENAERFTLTVSGQGRYTFAVTENNATTGYLHLIDRATGSDIDLLATPEYTFYATGASSDRFMVKLTPSMDENGNVTFVRVSGDHLIIDGEGELQVFDVMGRQLGSAQVSGTTTLDRGSLGMVSAGVYVMRLDGNTQKIVVK